MTSDMQNAMEIAVDDDVRKMVEESGEDYRICTACLGPALVPVSVKSPKASDEVISLGNGRKIFVSRVQARYVTRISMDMLYDEEEIDSCPAFYAYSEKKHSQE
jgi:hypothetical protein